jgi:hypothetical protein
VRRYFLPAVTVLTVLFAGCKKEEPPRVTAHEVEKKVAEAAGTAADYAKQEKDEYVAQAQKAVDEARAKIDALKAEAKKARAGARRKARGQVETMEGRWRVAERKLGELKAASGEAWKDLRSGVDKAVADLKKASSKHHRTASSAGR